MGIDFWETASAPLLGGALIGVAVTLMLLLNGRVTGISGIIGTAMTGSRAIAQSDFVWRVAFILGLVVGGLGLRSVSREWFVNTSGRTLGEVALAGLLVGFGTLMANGCTSGHGVCGISRMSVRSMLATITFIAFGILSVMFMRMAFGGM